MCMVLFVQHVEVDSKRPASVGDSRGELLDQIRQGVELKSVSQLFLYQ
jgi:WH2 motif.